MDIMPIKFKQKDSVHLCRGMESNRLEEMVQRALNFALNRFEEEGFDTASAHLEASKVVFGYANDFINGSTIAQWLAAGGDERRAFEAIKDYIVEAKKVKVVDKEVKTISARVFRSG
jgi:hypothetical protein